MAVSSISPHSNTNNMQYAIDLADVRVINVKVNGENRVHAGVMHPDKSEFLMSKDVTEDFYLAVVKNLEGKAVTFKLPDGKTYRMMCARHEEGRRKIMRVRYSHFFKNKNFRFWSSIKNGRVINFVMPLYNGRWMTSVAICKI